MILGEQMHGFTVDRIRNVGEGGAELVEMTHGKTGARLAWMNNGEENKLFSIAFKTIPSDDTGVFHILEHSVLSGSKLYPVKEPFLELLKSSMNTFLNAMTFPDKTVFPVSSRNDTDFMNLTRVYLDAVFCPSIYDNPCIFRQEGWHIELRDKSDAPLYKGVVFNEMKGALSSVYRRIGTETEKLLFPDSCYRFESGGDPAAIPDLTYERFTELHGYFYHPSNSYIYLDGSVDIDAVLELLDTEYLSKYDRTDNRYDIAVQPQIAAVECSRDYEVSPDEPLENRTHLACAKVLCSWEDREKIFAASVLGEVLTGHNDAPLKRALLDTGLCLDASLSVSDGIQQPFGILEILNTDYENRVQLLDTIQKVVSDLTENGIDREALSAAVNRLEFRWREGEEPQGLNHNINALSAWLYGGDPLSYIDCDDVFVFLRKQLDTDYYEKLLSEWLLDESGRATLYMIPSYTYGNELREQEEKRLQDIIGSMTESDMESLIQQNRRLDEWQQSEDAPETLALLPRLPLSEVSELPIRFDTTETTESGVAVLLHPSKEKGIVSVNLYFSLADCTEQEIFDLSVMTNLLGNLPTKSSDGMALQQKITALLGGIDYNVEAFGKAESPEKCRAFFTVMARFLEQNRNEALSLIGEILTETVFDLPDLIKELLLQGDEELKHGIISSGHIFALGRARAPLSAEDSLKELTSGYEGYKRLHSLTQNIDEQMPGLITSFKKLQSKILGKSRLTASVTSADGLPLTSLLSQLPDGESTDKTELSYSLQTPKAQGILIPAAVSYSAVSLPQITDMAVWRVLSNILSLEYLWTEIRVKGGAYGTGATVNPLGIPAFYSYRDPSPSDSFSVYGSAAEFLREYCAQPLPEQYIISTIAKYEPLMSDSEKGITADDMYFRGITYEKRCAERKKMLSLIAEELLSAADTLSQSVNRCVVGSAEALERCGELETETIG
ncbi:MAG: insulinase family protein [Eubacterium sp.]|nr:insulinase family protein [Eubacterium sp.]